jgi:hypothetical protein
MIGRDFYKRLRLLNGRSETIRTRFELNQGGQLIEHITLETHDRPTPGAPWPGTSIPSGRGINWTPKKP